MRFVISQLFPNNIKESFGPTHLIDADSALEGAKLHYHLNRSYHCQQCGRVWAEWEKESVDLSASLWSQEWYPFRRSCPSHATGFWRGDIPGSMLLYHTDICVLPRSLLEQELIRLTVGNGEYE